ncbi:MAG: hypothetical protein ACREHC_00880, partial [Candidatus Levyibacteriota bacterium]
MDTVTETQEAPVIESQEWHEIKIDREALLQALLQNNRDEETEELKINGEVGAEEQKHSSFFEGLTEAQALLT